MQSAASYARQGVIDLVSDDGHLVDPEEMADNHAAMWAWGLARELLRMHDAGEELHVWSTELGA